VTEITTETISTQPDSGGTVVSAPGRVEQVAVGQTTVEATNSQTTEYIIYFFFGALEILLAFRLVLKIMGASTISAFVRGIYGITGLFIMPFEGIFRRGFNEGLETTSVIEPSTIVAMLVYAIVAWGIVKLVHVLSREKQGD
jgi:hypothetical protein